MMFGNRTSSKLNWQTKFIVGLACFGVGRMIYVILEYYGVARG